MTTPQDGRVRTVGELRQQLERFPDDLVIALFDLASMSPIFLKGAIGYPGDVVDPVYGPEHLARLGIRVCLLTFDSTDDAEWHEIDAYLAG